MSDNKTEDPISFDDAKKIIQAGFTKKRVTKNDLVAAVALYVETAFRTRLTSVKQEMDTECQKEKDNVAKILATAEQHLLNILNNKEMRDAIAILAPLGFSSNIPSRVHELEIDFSRNSVYFKTGRGYNTESGSVLIKALPNQEEVCIWYHDAKQASLKKERLAHITHQLNSMINRLDQITNSFISILLVSKKTGNRDIIKEIAKQLTEKQLNTKATDAGDRFVDILFDTEEVRFLDSI